MILIDAAKKAAEALESAGYVGGYAPNWFEKEIAALRTAIADAERCEPVAHVYTLTKTGSLASWEPTAAAFSMGDGQHRLYVHPPMLTDAAVERAARAIFSTLETPIDNDSFSQYAPSVQNAFRRQARAALAAAWGRND